MPGICGALRVDKEEYGSFWREFSQPWVGCQVISFPGGFLGGHAFGSTSAVRKLNESCYIVVDGEASIYSFLPTQENGTGPFRTSPEGIRLNEVCKGNVVQVDLRSRVCHLEAEQTGTFPLYYTLTASRQLLFSSRLKPLARVINASPDWVGISEFVTKRYTFHRRTHFQNIFRLLPGQAITYQLDTGQLTIREPRITWVGNKAVYPSEMDYEVLWDGLRTAVKRCFDSEKRHGLMMSGGWDSRLLLGAMLEQLGSHKVVAYTWGDPRSYDQRVAKQICQSTGVECIVEPLNDTLYEPGFLERTFHRVENVLYPQWHRASEQLSAIGVQSVSAGVYGEILGGHYGPAMVLAGMRKAIVVGAALIGIPVLFNSFERLRYPRVARKPWYITTAAWAGMHDATREMNDDIESVWRNLEQLGIESREQLIEAFMALTRGSRLINQQILSCRTDLDVALPFIDFNLLRLSSQIHQCAKIHNTINRKLLQRYSAPLLQFVTGATLVPASMPIFTQEASRVIRFVGDNVSDKVYKFMDGRIRMTRLGSWVYDFLRNGRALRKVLDDLRSDIWDRDAIDQSIKNIAVYKEASMYDVNTNFLTIYTTDLMLR